MTTETPRRSRRLGWLFGRGEGAPPAPAAEPAAPAAPLPGPTFYAELAEKVGAGVLLTCQDTGDVLLLLRNSIHNNRTWGLAGGNADETDGMRARPLPVARPR